MAYMPRLGTYAPGLSGGGGLAAFNCHAMLHGSTSSIILELWEEAQSCTTYNYVHNHATRLGIERTNLNIFDYTAAVASFQLCPRTQRKQKQQKQLVQHRPLSHVFLHSLQCHCCAVHNPMIPTRKNNPI